MAAGGFDLEPFYDYYKSLTTIIWSETFCLVNFDNQSSK